MLFNNLSPARKTLFFRPPEIGDRIKEVGSGARSPEPVSHPSRIHSSVPDGREMRGSTFNEV